MDQQHDAIRHPRPHRLSLSSLSSISTDGSSEDDHYTPLHRDLSSDYFDSPLLGKQEQEQQQYRNIQPLPTSPSRQLAQRYDNNLMTAKDHQHVATHPSSTAHIDLLSPRSSIDNPTDPTSDADSSPSPSSPVPSSLLTFWASPTSISNEQQHGFVTKNAHIKRPRNAWIHFRCYFGQSLKAKDPTIRAEEISKRASEYWSRLTSKQKKPWHVMAEQEKLAHQEAFPDYRYRPKRALPKSVVLAYPSSTPSHPLASTSRYELDKCSKKFRLA
ncbi:hypothetical protein BC941DRAFT_53798 [Chlamydoabsidia padenii]|nr:hypothetical protein BC941DRAFT_53798 [Chlamydoabsidia padenii]